jgi:hypothetical protein
MSNRLLTTVCLALDKIRVTLAEAGQVLCSIQPSQVPETGSLRAETFGRAQGGVNFKLSFFTDGCTTVSLPILISRIDTR